MTTYNCRVKDHKPTPTLYVRVTTPVSKMSEHLGRAYGAIMDLLMQQGEQPAGAPFTLYHNMDMDALDIEIGMPVSRPLTGQGEVKAGELPGGKWATCLHVGPYMEVGPAYDALTEWVKTEGYVPTGIAIEFYLNDPGETPESELQTEVVFPLKASVMA